MVTLELQHKNLKEENLQIWHAVNLVGGWKVHPMEIVDGKFPPTCGAFFLRLNRSFDASLTENMAANCRARLSQCAQANRTSEGWFFWYRLFGLCMRICHSLSLNIVIVFNCWINIAIDNHGVWWNPYPLVVAIEREGCNGILYSDTCLCWMNLMVFIKYYCHRMTRSRPHCLRKPAWRGNDQDIIINCLNINRQTVWTIISRQLGSSSRVHGSRGTLRRSRAYGIRRSLMHLSLHRRRIKVHILPLTWIPCIPLHRSPSWCICVHFRTKSRLWCRGNWRKPLPFPQLTLPFPQLGFDF